jgi:hypothetical protein
VSRQYIIGTAPKDRLFEPFSTKDTVTEPTITLEALTGNPEEAIRQLVSARFSTAGDPRMTMAFYGLLPFRFLSLIATQFILSSTTKLVKAGKGSLIDVDLKVGPSIVGEIPSCLCAFFLDDTSGSRLAADVLEDPEALSGSPAAMLMLSLVSIELSLSNGRWAKHSGAIKNAIKVAPETLRTDSMSDEMEKLMHDILNATATGIVCLDAGYWQELAERSAEMLAPSGQLGKIQTGKFLRNLQYLREGVI